MLKRYFVGFKMVLNGRRVLTHVPGIRLWLVIPFVIQILLLSVGLYFGVTELKTLAASAVAYILSDPTTVWATIIYSILYFFSVLVFAVLYFYLLYILSSIINTPFYAIIAEKILNHEQAISNDKKWQDSIISTFRMLKTSLLRAAFLLAVGIVIFLASFVPGLNIFAAFSIFFVIACDSADYAFESAEMNFRQRLDFVKKFIPEFLGMATFIALTALVPGLILFVMPFAVLGSTQMVAQELKTIKNRIASENKVGIQ